MSKPIYLFSISSHEDTININSLDVVFFKPDVEFESYDYFIITSKQTSQALKQYANVSLKPALCVSVASAKSYEEIGGEVLGIGGGYGDNLIEKIRSYPKDKRWLYLRAKVVASDFVSICQKDGYNIDEVVMYESGCSKEIENVKVEDNSIFIFTSPSSVKCFLKNHTISEDANIIVIGKTTAKALPSNLTYIISNETTIQSCVEIAMTL